jgi:vitamin B12 transporter
MKRQSLVQSAVLSQFLILIFCTIAFGQGRASVKGVVTDEHAAVIAQAEVKLSGRVGIQLLAETDASGAYEFKDLPPGDYVIEVNAKGFANYVSETLRLARGQTVTNDARLPVAKVIDTVYVTASGTAQRIDEISKAVSVVENKTIEERREFALPESLRGLPGVRIQQQGSYGQLTTIRLRGQRNFDTAFLLDGLRIRDGSDINGSAVSFITDLVPVDLDRIEILRGSASSIYGTNAIGGAINLVPETGTGDAHFEFGFDGGSLALYRERLKGSGGLGKRSGFSFGVTRIDVRHGIDGNDKYGNTAGSGRWQFNPRPSITISANFYGTISNAQLNDSPFALPAAFTSGLYPAAVPGVTFQPDFNNPDQGRRNRILAGSVRFLHQLNEAVSYSVAYQHVGARRRNYNGAQVDPAFAAFYPFGDFAFINVNNGATDTLDARANFKLGRHNLFTAGFEYEHESIFQSSTPSFAAFNNTTDTQRTMAVFGQDQIFLLDDRLQISVALRGQFFRVRAADRPGFLSAINPENSITGDASFAYFIRSSNTKIRAHVGNGFRAASLFERFGAGTFGQVGFVRFGDPTLRAEKSIGFDTGIDQRLAGDKLRAGITYFYTHLDRTIVFQSTFIVDPLAVGRFSGYVNRPGGLSRGIETYAEATPWRQATLRASYTYTNSDQVVGGQLKPEYVIPHHLFGLNLNQRWRTFQINFDLNRTGAYLAPVFESNFPFRMAELTFPGYTKADLYGSYERRLSERQTITLFAGVDNLFGSEYYENGFRAPGAVGRGGVTIRFW